MGGIIGCRDVKNMACSLLLAVSFISPNKIRFKVGYGSSFSEGASAVFVIANDVTKLQVSIYYCVPLKIYLY